MSPNRRCRSSSAGRSTGLAWPRSRPRRGARRLGRGRRRLRRPPGRHRLTPAHHGGGDPTTCSHSRPSSRPPSGSRERLLPTADREAVRHFVRPQLQRRSRGSTARPPTAEPQVGAVRRVHCRRVDDRPRGHSHPPATKRTVSFAAVSRPLGAAARVVHSDRRQSRSSRDGGRMVSA